MISSQKISSLYECCQQAVRTKPQKILAPDVKRSHPYISISFLCWWQPNTLFVWTWELTSCWTFLIDNIESVCKYSEKFQLQVNTSNIQFTVCSLRRARVHVLVNLNINILFETIPTADCIRNLGMFVEPYHRLPYNTSRLIEWAFGALKVIFINIHFFNRSTRLLYVIP